MKPPPSNPSSRRAGSELGLQGEEAERVGSMGPACSGLVGTELHTGLVSRFHTHPSPIRGPLGGCQASALPSLLSGMAAYMKQLLDQHHSVTGQLQALQVGAGPFGEGQLPLCGWSFSPSEGAAFPLQTQLRRVEESQHATLREELKELKEQLEGESQAREREIQEEGKQQREVS